LPPFQPLLSSDHPHASIAHIRSCQVPIEVKVGRNTIVVQIIARIRPDGRGGVTIVVVDARVDIIALVAGIVLVDGLVAHAVRCGLAVIPRDVRRVNGLVYARAVLGTTKDECVIVRIGDVKGTSVELSTSAILIERVVNTNVVRFRDGSC